MNPSRSHYLPLLLTVTNQGQGSQPPLHTALCLCWCALSNSNASMNNCYTSMADNTALAGRHWETPEWWLWSQGSWCPHRGDRVLWPAEAAHQRGCQRPQDLGNGSGGATPTGRQQRQVLCGGDRGKGQDGWQGLQISGSCWQLPQSTVMTPWVATDRARQWPTTEQRVMNTEANSHGQEDQWVIGFSPWPAQGCRKIDWALWGLCAGSCSPAGSTSREAPTQWCNLGLHFQGCFFFFEWQEEMKCKAHVPQCQFPCGTVKGLLQTSSAGLAQPFMKNGLALCFMLKMFGKDVFTSWPSLLLNSLTTFISARNI